MDFSKKIKLFSFGLLLGTFFLITFLNGKKVSCNYGPESRVINNLKQKKWIFENEKIALDSFNIIKFLENSKVDFNKSNTKKDSCRVYYLMGVRRYEEIIINAVNCSKIVKAKILIN
ncbi:MAG: hypothetical protein CMC23_00560 [Flavobacteriaceae bacterium]|nr:hypothetical protein [Flavobacteriaceae bacterium]|tara:strand:+ start:1274 stop:1624 length:351 start_codon:yes stop_codon:yes gene_type:complete